MEVNSIQGGGYDSNIYLLRDEKSVLVDAGTGHNSEFIINKLGRFGFDPENLDVLINTHCHYDHVGGDPFFKEEFDCDIVASEKTADFLREPNGEAILLEMFDADFDSLEVSRRLEDGQTFDLGDSELEVIETPGHSVDSISLYEPDEKVLFSGDTVFGNGIGRVDLPTSDSEEMKKSLKKLSNLDVKELYPGHGPIVTREAQRCIRRSLNFLP